MGLWFLINPMLQLIKAKCTASGMEGSGLRAHQSCTEDSTLLSNVLLFAPPASLPFPRTFAVSW